MAYSLNYIPLYNLQSYIIDKNTGLPLSNGTITFYKDNQRTIKKDVFTMVGSYGYYDYVSISNPCTLNSTGSPVDNDGVPIIIYTYPFDIETGERELYYMVVEDQYGEVQYNWGGIPWNPLGDTPVIDTIDNINYVKNGQFNNINSDIVLEATYYLSKCSYLSDNGYIFYINGGEKLTYSSVFVHRNVNTTLDTVSMKEFQSNDVSGSVDGYASRYLYFTSLGESGLESVKDIVFKIGDYSMFAGSDITVSVQGFSNLTGNSSKIKVFAVQNNGLGSDITTFSVDPVEISLTSDLTKYFFNIHVPDLEYLSSQDGYFAIGIRYPLNLPCQIGITNIQVNEGLVELPYSYEGASTISAISIADMISSIPEPGTDDPETYPLGLNGSSFISPVYGRDAANVSLPYFTWYSTLPTGMVCPWTAPESTIPEQFKILDGRALSSYKFNRLYSQYSSNYTTTPIYGVGKTAVSTIAIPETVNVINNTNGACAAPSNTVTGIDINVIQNGDPTHALSYEIIVTADFGSGISSEGTLTVDTIGKYWSIKFILDNIIDNTIITNSMLYDDSTILIYIRSEWDKYKIAQAINRAFTPSLSFLLPDWRAMFPRGVNGTRSDGYADTDAVSRADRGDGTTGNNVGTKQTDETYTHTHSATTNTTTTSSVAMNGGTIVVPVQTAVSRTSTTTKDDFVVTSSSSSSTTVNNTGGSETRPCNIYCYWIIKT